MTTLYLCVDKIACIYISDVDDDARGQFFHSKYYPNLKFFVQTGFDYEQGNYF